MKKLLFVLILFICFVITGCEDNMDQEEIDRIGNLINGTENGQE